MKIAVCDDNQVIGLEIEKKLLDYAKASGLTMKIGLFISGEDFMDRLRTGESYDLIFLDIELGRTTGIEVGHVIRHELDDHVSKIVFITSKTGYEKQLFEVQPLYFLTKPLEEKKLIHCVHLALKLLQLENKTFSYKKGGKITRVRLKDVLYFESKNKQVIIHLMEGEDLFYDSLERVKEALPASFVQIHRSFLVDFEKVKGVKRKSLVMVNGSELPISQKYRLHVRKKIFEAEEERRID